MDNPALILSIHLFTLACGFAWMSSNFGIKPTRALKTFGFGLLLAGTMFLPWEMVDEPIRGFREYNLMTRLSIFPVIAFVAATGVLWGLYRERVTARLNYAEIFFISLTFAYMCRSLPWIAPIPAIVVLMAYYFKTRAQLALGIGALILSAGFCVRPLISDGAVLLLPAHLPIHLYFLRVILVSGSLFYLAICIYPLAVLIANQQLVNDLRIKKNGSVQKLWFAEQAYSESFSFICGRVVTRDIPPSLIMLITVLHGGSLVANWYWEFLSSSQALVFAVTISPRVVFAIANRLIPPTVVAAADANPKAA